MASAVDNKPQKRRGRRKKRSEAEGVAKLVAEKLEIYLNYEKRENRFNTRGALTTTPRMHVVDRAYSIFERTELEKKARKQVVNDAAPLISPRLDDDAIRCGVSTQEAKRLVHNANKIYTETPLDKLSVIHRYRPHSRRDDAPPNGKVQNYRDHVGAVLGSDQYCQYYVRRGLGGNWRSASARQQTKKSSTGVKKKTQASRSHKHYSNSASSDDESETKSERGSESESGIESKSKSDEKKDRDDRKDNEDGDKKDGVVASDDDMTDFSSSEPSRASSPARNDVKNDVDQDSDVDKSDGDVRSESRQSKNDEMDDEDEGKVANTEGERCVDKPRSQLLKVMMADEKLASEERRRSSAASEKKRNEKPRRRSERKQSSHRKQERVVSDRETSRERAPPVSQELRDKSASQRTGSQSTRQRSLRRQSSPNDNSRRSESRKGYVTSESEDELKTKSESCRKSSDGGSEARAKSRQSERVKSAQSQSSRPVSVSSRPRSVSSRPRSVSSRPRSVNSESPVKLASRASPRPRSSVERELQDNSPYEGSVRTVRKSLQF